MKCDTCRKEYSPDCDYRQGRCPHHPPLVELSTLRKIGLLLLAPFIIGAWCICNPKKVWEQAKKEYNL